MTKWFQKILYFAEFIFQWWGFEITSVSLANVSGHVKIRQDYTEVEHVMSKDLNFCSNLLKNPTVLMIRI